MERSPCLRIPRGKGDAVIRFLKDAGLYRLDLKPRQTNGTLLIPIVGLTEDAKARLGERLTEFDVVEGEFDGRSARPARISALLEAQIPSEMHPYLPRSFDLIGTVAIVELRDELAPYAELIGKAMVRVYPRVRTVLAKGGAFKGRFRVRDYVLLLGKETETVYREHGCLYHLDVAKVYFSPRLAYERMRVSSQVREGEVVLDMFAGVGPFSILIAKMHRDVRVYCADINPDAFGCLVKNILVNKVAARVTPALAEARTLIRSNFSKCFDRVVMNLPGEAVNFLDVAVRALKSGGMIHCYAFADRLNGVQKVRERIAEELGKLGRRFDLLEGREVRATAPCQFQVVQDIRVE